MTLLSLFVQKSEENTLAPGRGVSSSMQGTFPREKSYKGSPLVL